MDRKLSFRVWHIPSATMHNYLKAKFGPKGMNVTLGGKFKDVEQTTTLTVPNRDRAEIYEGDVVSWHEKPNAVITWLESGCWGTSQGNPLGRSAKLCRVIGDIYSNPELLAAS